MPGDERERFCARCSRTVVNLSGLTAAERATLLAQTDPRDLCVAYYQRLSGEYVTAEKPLTVGESRRVVQLGVTALAAGAAVAALHYARPIGETVLRAQPDLAARISSVAERTTELIDHVGEKFGRKKPVTLVLGMTRAPATPPPSTP